MEHREELLEIPVLDAWDDDTNFELDLDNLPQDLQALLLQHGSECQPSPSATGSLSLHSLPSEFGVAASSSLSHASEPPAPAQPVAGLPPAAAPLPLGESGGSFDRVLLPAGQSPGIEWQVDFKVLRRSNTLAAGLPAALQRSARKIEKEALVVAQASRTSTPAWRASSACSASSGALLRLAKRALNGSMCCSSAASVAADKPQQGPIDDDIDALLQGTIRDDDVERFMGGIGRSQSECAYALSPPRGLINLGNTCFLNAAVQALGHCGPLTMYFLQGFFVPDLNEANPLGTGCVLVMVFTALLHELFTLRPVSEEGWRDFTGQSASSGISLLAEDLHASYLSPQDLDSSSVFPPFDFLLAVAKFHPFLASGEMHDAQELLAWLLGALHEDLSRVKRRPSTRESGGCLRVDGAQLAEKGQERYAAEAWRDHLRFNRSVIVDLFQGQLRSQLRCPDCGSLSVTFDPFLHLTLPLAADAQTVRLEDAVELFCSEESLDADNLWECPCCSRRVLARKKLDLWKLPPILMIHLKRFEWVEQRSGPGCMPTYHVRKLNCVVEVQQDRLDLGKLVMPQAPQKEALEYDLIAVVDHLGVSVDTGHYTATCRRPDGWHRFDDAVAQKVSASSVVNRHNYVLFFQRGGLQGPEAIAEQRASAPHAWPHVIDMDWSFLSGSASDLTGLPVEAVPYDGSFGA